MLRDILKNYKLDILVILLLSAAALAVSVVNHAEMKPVTRIIAYSGPIVFTSALMALIAAMNLAKRYPVAAKARRICVDIAVGAVAISTSMFKAEMFYAPIAYYQETTPQVVIEQIASDDDIARYQAWSRLLTLPILGREEVAQGMAALLIGTDEGAKHSAELTLDYALRRHSITTLITLVPELRAYLEAKSAGLPPTPEATRAAAYTQQMVETGYKSILNAITPKNRDKLPPGGIDALFLALATNEVIGQLFLKSFSEQGDELLKPKAMEVLQLVAFNPTT